MDKVIIETSSVRTAPGKEFKAPAQKREIAKTIKLPDGVKKDDFKSGKPQGTYEEGTETLKIAGTEIKTTWYKYKFEVAGTKTEARLWLSDEVPGRVVKSESTTTGAVTVTSAIKSELVEFKK